MAFMLLTLLGSYVFIAFVCVRALRSAPILTAMRTVRIRAPYSGSAHRQARTANVLLAGWASFVANGCHRSLLKPTTFLAPLSVHCEREVLGCRQSRVQRGRHLEPHPHLFLPTCPLLRLPAALVLQHGR